MDGYGWIWMDGGIDGYEGMDMDGWIDGGMDGR